MIFLNIFLDICAGYHDFSVAPKKIYAKRYKYKKYTTLNSIDLSYCAVIYKEMFANSGPTPEIFSGTPL